MIDFLQERGQYNSNGLTLDEQSELEMLRLQVGEYRAREHEQESYSNSSEDEMNEEEERMQELHIEKRLSMKPSIRGAVSAEVWGEFNKKEDFKPVVVKKSNEQKDKIKIRLLQSFLFGSLEHADLKIVIDAMSLATFKFIFNKSRRYGNKAGRQW